MDNNIFTIDNKEGKLKRLINFLTNITHKEQNNVIGLSKTEKRRISKLLIDCLNTSGGEVAARQRAADIGQTYLELDKTGRLEILKLIASLEYDNEKISQKINILCRDLENGKYKEENIYALKNVLKSPRITILKQFNFLEQGIELLVEMREDLINFIEDGNKELKSLDNDFDNLLSSWFDVGFLELEEITWNSSASLLQKVIQYEAVHKIQSWSDLENRLDEDRKFYAFFHPRMKNVPLIFVEVALMDKIANSVQEILDEKAPIFNVDRANTAIFYSISNTQNGLRGISFGNFLIKKVVANLKKEYPQLKNFVTLSPIPRFVPWLKKEIKNGTLESIINQHLKIEKDPKSKNLLNYNVKNLYNDIVEIVNNPIDGFKGIQQDYLINLIKPTLEMLCAYYLLNKDKAWSNDPVLKFHLTNGAEVHRINWMGDTSENGMNQSLGMMVNYYYNLRNVEENHESFNDDVKKISYSVKSLLAIRKYRY